jgi:hypothetical protein
LLTSDLETRSVSHGPVVELLREVCSNKEVDCQFDLAPASFAKLGTPLSGGLSNWKSEIGWLADRCFWTSRHILRLRACLT